MAPKSTNRISARTILFPSAARLAILWLACATPPAWSGPVPGIEAPRSSSPGFKVETNYPPAIAVNPIFEGGIGRLWMGHDQGLVGVDRDSLREMASGRAERVNPVPCDLKDASPALESHGRLSHPAGARTRDGSLWSPTVRGAVRLAPDNLPDPPNGATPVLERLDSAWIEAGARRRVFCANLKPGRYRFHLVARDKYGREASIAVPVDLRLAPYLHERAWFGWACLGLGLAFLGGLYSYREQHLRHIRGVEAEALRERERLARDLHDGMGAHLTQIALLAADPSDDASPDSAARRARLSRATREAAQSLRDIVWSARPEHDNLASLVARLELYAGDALEAAGVQSRFRIPVEIPNRPVPFAVRTAVFLVVKEALHNAVRHAHASTVHLRLDATASDFRLLVEDDGVGFEPNRADHGNPTGAQAGGGLGLSSMRRRIESIGGVFELDSRLGAGTRIRVTVPIPTDLGHE